MRIKVLSYNYTYNELTVMSSRKEYTYEHISPYIYNLIVQYIKNKWYGKAWKLLRNMRLKKETTHA